MRSPDYKIDLPHQKQKQNFSQGTAVLNIFNK